MNKKQLAKQDHDHVKGSKVRCFCIDTLVSSSDLLCSVDFCQYDEMFEEKKRHKGLSNPSIFSMR